MYLSMKELFDWRYIQTDPNWSNFLYDRHTVHMKWVTALKGRSGGKVVQGGEITQSAHVGWSRLVLLRLVYSSRTLPLSSFSLSVSLSLSPSHTYTHSLFSLL
jgi:hypothetical protein